MGPAVFKAFRSVVSAGEIKAAALLGMPPYGIVAAPATPPNAKVCVSSFEDPEVPGILCFISQPEREVTASHPA